MKIFICKLGQPIRIYIRKYANISVIPQMVWEMPHTFCEGRLALLRLGSRPSLWI